MLNVKLLLTTPTAAIETLFDITALDIQVQVDAMLELI